MKILSSGNEVMSARRQGFPLYVAAACLLAELATTSALPLKRLRSTSDSDSKLGSVREVSSNTTNASPEEITEAIKSLSLMRLKAQERQDTKSLQCKVFQENSDRLFTRVAEDLTRINAAKSATQARLASARASLNGAEKQRGDSKERHAEELKVLQRRIDSEQDRLSKTLEDLQNSAFMLDVTKCGSAMLLSDINSTSNGFKLCQKAGRGHQLDFQKARLQNIASRLTPQGQWQLQLALGRSRLASQQTLLRQVLGKDGSLDAMEDGDELKLVQAEARPVDENLANKCTINMTPTCGEMHDVFASLWGDMTDSADQIKESLQAMKVEQGKFRANFQAELVAIGNSQGMLEASVVDIKSLQSELDGELGDKTRETARMKLFVSQAKQECNTTLHEIEHEEMCSISKLRSELAAELNGGSLEDCQVGEWKQSSRCSKDCGGGTQIFKRKLVKQGSSLGMPCPALEVNATCNEGGCPVDCKLGQWQFWSECTQECGGGLRYRTRPREVEPKNGGFSCDVMQETQQCNTGACDRNCQLGEWSTFSSCSQACDGGVKSRRKSVLRPAVGSGKCAEEESIDRLNQEQCNTNKCGGNETCTSKLDVVIAIDGSGSMTAKGFAVLQTFAAKLVRRFVGGDDKVRVGVVQFGNGALDENKVVSDAVAALPLNTDMQRAASTISGLGFQQGFTNLAQAVMKARDVLQSASQRPGAEGVVIMLTDGRPSFKDMTSRAVQQLKGKARLMVVHVKSFPAQHNTELLKSYATEPEEVNYVHIAGKSTLEKSYDSFVTKLIAQACPNVS